MHISGEAKVIIGIVLATLLIVIGAIFLFGGQSGSTTIAPEKVDQKLLVREDSHKIESPNTKVTIVEFLDPECEACRAAYPTVKQILKEYEGKITFVVRYFPLHKNSVLAAKSLEAAGEQGKYWEMIDKLFTNQTEWGEKQEPQTELFLKYAQELGLDLPKFKKAAVKKEYEDKINRDKNDGIAAGVQGTPTFFINGELVGNVMSYDELKGKIDSALQK